MQQQGLGAVVAHLPEMEPQYRMMVQSLDNTRHHMKTSELVVPSEGVCVCTCVGGCACTCVWCTGIPKMFIMGGNSYFSAAVGFA